MSGARTAVVLAGGGARGAYEAGGLSVLLPELERRGERPTMYAGASAGAINGVKLASMQHRPAEEAVEEILSIWRNLRACDVFRRIVGEGGARTLARLLGELLPGPGPRLHGLLDSAPLWRNVEHWVDWDALHANVREERLDGLAVVATSARTGKTVVFCEEPASRPPHRSHAIAYVPVEIGLEHVRASGSIPVLWPPGWVDSPERARGWYYDGGTRLNAPIKPVLDLGAERLVVMAVDSVAGPVMEPGEQPGDEPPDFGDGMLHLLDGVLVDPLIEDMRTLGNVNAFFAGSPDPGAQLYRTVRGKAPYKRIPYALVAPARRGAIGALASEIFTSRYRGLGGLRSPDVRLIGALVGDESPTHGEMLSLLLFDRDFIDELIEMGRRDARAWLEDDHDGEGPWQIGPLGTFVTPRQWTAG